MRACSRIFSKRLLSFALCFPVLFFSGQAFAQLVARSKSEYAVDAKNINYKDLIGYELIGRNVPEGWKDVGGGVIFGGSYGFAKYSRNDELFLLFDKKINDYGSLVKVQKRKILDIVKLKGDPKKGGWYQITGDCKKSGEDFIDDKSKIFFAEVVFNKCQRYSSKVLSAWVFDKNKENISSYPIKDLRCGNDYLDSGEIEECKFIPREW